MLDAISGEKRKAPIPSFLRVGSWIGGDRDGNPFVTADVLNEAMRLQSARALALLSRRIARARRRTVARLEPRRRHPGARRARRPRRTIRRRRRDEPYRRAITGMYSRLAKTAQELDHVVALRQPIVDAPAYASVDEFAADLAMIAQSLKATGGAIVARGRLRSLQRAVDVFGFHLAPIDLRQNAKVHERTVAEILAAVSPGFDYRSLERGRARRAPAQGAASRRARSSRPSSPMARRRPGSWRSSAPPRRSAQDTAPARSAPRSSRIPTAYRTCWSWRCS